MVAYSASCHIVSNPCTSPPQYSGVWRKPKQGVCRVAKSGPVPSGYYSYRPAVSGPLAAMTHHGTMRLRAMQRQRQALRNDDTSPGRTHDSHWQIQHGADFPSPKWVWLHRLQNGSHFFAASSCWSLTYVSNLPRCLQHLIYITDRVISIILCTGLYKVWRPPVLLECNISKSGSLNTLCFRFRLPSTTLRNFG